MSCALVNEAVLKPTSETKCKLKSKNHITISTDEVKVFDKIQHWFMIKEKKKKKPLAKVPLAKVQR